VIAKVEWYLGELYPRVGFIITNMSRPAKNVVAFYNKRGTCEQWIKEGKGAIKWTRLSCRSFAANAVRLQLHALAYSEKPVHRHPAADRRTTTTARYIHSVRRSTVMRSMQSVGKVRLDDGKHNIFRSEASACPDARPQGAVAIRACQERQSGTISG
jgi:hypothetical protein